MVRREFLFVLGGVPLVAPWLRAKKMLRRGDIGNVAFCRILDSGGDDMIDAVRFLLEKPVVTSYGRARRGEGGVWLYGSEGTLRVSGSGLRVWKAEV